MSEQPEWDEQWWVRLLDRIEHREVGVGLRFWGPPLWLEVTMTGPDSDHWSVAHAGALPDQPWNWESTAPCHEAGRLVAAGADEASVLAAVSEYTLQNLVLNAVHEIGEWLRFDAKRLFPAHGSDRAIGDGVQGNGSVRVEVNFAPRPEPGAAAPATVASEVVATRLAAVAAAWRFSSKPGTCISYSEHGPAVTDVAADGVVGGTFSGSPWSTATREATSTAEFVEAVQRDVHQLLIQREVHRICEAFTVDGHRPWYLRSGSGRGSPVSASVTYQT